MSETPDLAWTDEETEMVVRAYCKAKGYTYRGMDFRREADRGFFESAVLWSLGVSNAA